MKIGILTFQYAYNYGALIQAYGLCRYLNNKGHDVHLINLIPKPFSFTSKIRHLASSFKELAVQHVDISSNMNKRILFNKFREHFLPLTSPCYALEDLKKISLDMDAVIVGSDQVWNGDFIRNIESHYFLDFITSPHCRRISYAASFGNPAGEQPEELLVTAKEFLNGFDSISVRDEISADIVEQLSDLKAKIVLDPTLLYDFKDFCAESHTNL